MVFGLLDPSVARAVVLEEHATAGRRAFHLQPAVSLDFDFAAVAVARGKFSEL
jgi:hypothetical protein